MMLRTALYERTGGRASQDAGTGYGCLWLAYQRAAMHKDFKSTDNVNWQYR